MNCREFMALYNSFSGGYRHAHYDKEFIRKSKEIINNIMKVDGISREDAGIKLIIMCKKNNCGEVDKYYV